MRIIRKILSSTVGVKPVRFKTVASLEKIANAKDWVIVDIRPRGEFLGYRLWTSINIPITSFEKKFSKEVQMDMKVLIVSRNGYECRRLFKQVFKDGYDAYVLKDGINGVYESKNKKLIFSEKWK